MNAHRDASLPRETTLWHGPFEGQALSMLGALALAGLVLFGLFHHDANVFRSLRCQRPGRCVIERGADWYGPHADRAFDVANVTRVERGRTTGKNARNYLSLIITGEEPIRVLEGDQVARHEAEVRAFFEDAVKPSLAIRPDYDPAVPWTFSLFAASALFGAAIAGARTVRSRARFRIEMDEERGLLRVTRVSFGRPGEPLEVPLARITDVVVEHEEGTRKSRPARIVLITNEGRDQPLTPAYFHGPAVATTADELRALLQVPKG